MAEGPIVIDAGHGATLHVARCKHDLVGLAEPGLMAYKRDKHGDMIGSIVATADQARALAAALTTMADQIDPPAEPEVEVDQPVKCQHLGCCRLSVGGTPTPDGYRFVCLEHWHGHAEHRGKVLESALAAAQTKRDAA